MEVLVLDGKKYIKASKAAKDLGYTSDYVGQLCRSGKVGAHLIGRSWYVDHDELSTHKTEKKRISRIKSREQAKKSIAEHRLKVNNSNSQKNYQKVAISYEDDDYDLIPETRQVEIESQVDNVPKSRKSKKSPGKNIIENKGKKIIMSGNVSVIDVTEGVPDPHTTILSPKILTSDELAKEREKEEKEVKKRIKKNKKSEESTVKISRDQVQIRQKEVSDAIENSGFINRLKDAEVIQAESISGAVGEPSKVEDDVDYNYYPQSTIAERNKPIVPLLVVVFVTACMLLTISTSNVLSYTAESVVPISESLKYSFSETIKLLQGLF